MARIGARPLDDSKIPSNLNGAGPLYHAQIWYDDGSNSGFFDDDDIRPDKGHNISDYDFSRDSRHYNDVVMREAEIVVRMNWDMDWRIKNNCQDYTDAVREEYDRLMIQYAWQWGNSR